MLCKNNVKKNEYLMYVYVYLMLCSISYFSFLHKRNLNKNIQTQKVLKQNNNRQFTSHLFLLRHALITNLITVNFFLMNSTCKLCTSVYFASANVLYSKLFCAQNNIFIHLLFCKIFCIIRQDYFKIEEVENYLFFHCLRFQNN